MRKNISRGAAVLAMVCWLWPACSLQAQAPGNGKVLRRQQQQQAKYTITGKVVDSKGQPVAGASVHIKHHHHKNHAQAAAGAQNANGQKPVQQQKAHHNVVKTQADGSFTLNVKHPGNHRVVAHKKGVGHGHALVTVNANANANGKVNAKANARANARANANGNAKANGNAQQAANANNVVIHLHKHHHAAAGGQAKQHGHAAS